MTNRNSEIRTNEIRTNKIRTNEIRIRRGPPVVTISPLSLLSTLKKSVAQAGKQSNVNPRLSQIG